MTIASADGTVFGHITGNQPGFTDTRLHVSSELCYRLAWVSSHKSAAHLDASLVMAILHSSGTEFRG
jgi:hypothetical protein